MQVVFYALDIKGLCKYSLHIMQYLCKTSPFLLHSSVFESQFMVIDLLNLKLRVSFSRHLISQLFVAKKKKKIVKF